MANVKISELTSVTTPLAGTETLPVVQSSTTKKATVADVLNSVNATFTANGVAYANGSKVLTTGSALTFNGANLGVGALGSWSSNRKALQIGGNDVAALGLASQYSEITHNAISQTGSPVYATSNPAAIVDFNNAAAGGFAWRVAPTGTAGNTISFTQTLTLTSAGYLKASNDGTYNNVAGTYHELRTNGTANHCLYVYATAAATGNFGIAIQYPNRAPNDTSNEFLACTDSAATRMYVRSNGGISNYQANDTNLSDRREKHDFAPAKRYLDVVCAIPVQTFKYIDQTDDEPTLGVVAQDVQAVAPELVSESNWGTADEPKLRLSVYQTDLQYALMKAIQDLAADNQQLRARVEALEAAQTAVR